MALRSIRKISAVMICVLSGAALSACGYALQSSKESPLRDREGIRRVYVAPLMNSTYKPGVENMVYNELVKALGAGGRIQVVRTRDEADAILTGGVGVASMSPGAQTTANNINPIGEGSTDVLIATEYAANLNCSFTLTRKLDPNPALDPAVKPDPRYKPRKTVLWTGGFSRSKSFPANNQMGVLGTTSALINESEFDRALRDLAVSMMDELHESMLAMF